MAEHALHVTAEFTSLDDLEAAIHEYESTKYINLYKRSCRTIAGYCKMKNVANTIPEELKYAEIDYACIHGGKRFQTTSEGVRPNQRTLQQQCPMVVKVRLSQDQQKLVVKKLTEDHNHQISQMAYKHLPRQRKLDPKTREEVNRMLQMKVDKKLIQHHIFQSTGRIVIRKDLHNLRGRSRGADTENNLQALLYEMKKEPGSVTEVVIGTDHKLQGIYYQDHKMKQIQRAFPELMLIDATYKRNDLRIPLFVLMSVDGDGESHVIALWIVISEERATVAALTDIFVRLNSFYPIQCIMADNDMVERDVMQERIPHAALQICLLHTLKTFRREITCEKMGIKSEQRQFILETLQKMTYARDEDEYIKYYETLCDLNIKPVTDYFRTHWHGIRTQWVEGLKSQATHFMTSTNTGVESIIQKLKIVMSRYSGMVTFFHDLKTILAVLEAEINHRTLQKVQNSSSVQSSPNSPESQYLRLLTPYASRFVRTQLFSASLPTTTTTTTTVSDAATTTSCTCGFWRLLSLPCQHIFKKRSENGLPIYAEELVARRWRKSYYFDCHLECYPVFNETAEPARILTQQHTVLPEGVQCVKQEADIIAVTVIPEEEEEEEMPWISELQAEDQIQEERPISINEGPSICSLFTVLPEGVQRVKQETMWDNPEHCEQQGTDIIAVVVMPKEEEEMPQISELQTENYIQEERPISIMEGPSTCSLPDVNNRETDEDERNKDPKSPKMFLCEICGKHFQYKSNVKVLELIHTVEKPFRCEICGKQYTQKPHLNRHKLVHRDKNVFSCNFCEKGFSKNYDLQTHVRLHTTEKLFRSEICGKQCNQKSPLNKHKLVHSSMTALCCNYCGKGFPKNSDLEKHIRFHTGEKPFGCNICNKSFSQKSNLNSHMKLH